MASAYKTWWKQQNPGVDDTTVGVRAEIDPTSGDLRVWLQDLELVEVPAPAAPVEDGAEPAEPQTVIEARVLSEKEVKVTNDFKGRIGAQVAKQVIFQKLRDAEREMTYEEFAGREGDVVTGIVQQQERRYTLLDLGKVEALLPQAEQVPSEPYRHGERVKVYITEVRRGTKGPQIVVSRSHPGLLKRLFEMEVPEIAEGIVEIRGVAREAVAVVHRRILAQHAPVRYHAIAKRAMAEDFSRLRRADDGSHRDRGGGGAKKFAARELHGVRERVLHPLGQDAATGAVCNPCEMAQKTRTAWSGRFIFRLPR